MLQTHMHSPLIFIFFLLYIQQARIGIRFDQILFRFASFLMSTKAAGIIHLQVSGRAQQSQFQRLELPFHILMSMSNISIDHARHDVSLKNVIPLEGIGTFSIFKQYPFQLGRGNVNKNSLKFHSVETTIQDQDTLVMMCSSISTIFFDTLALS